jgi:hypothetical protein
MGLTNRICTNSISLRRDGTLYLLPGAVLARVIEELASFTRTG